MTENERKKSLETIVKRINDCDVAAFAIMDYWTFDGYISLRRFLHDNPAIKLEKAVFPGMELRVDAPVDYRLNIHVLLSDALSLQALADFKARLQISATERPLSDDALRDFARTLDPSKAKHHGFDDPATLDADQLLLLGSTTAEITRQCLKEALKAIPGNAGVILMPYDTSDGLQKLNWELHPHADNYFMQSAHMFETRDPSNVDLFLNRVTDKNKSFISNCHKTLGGRPKPAVCGSDAHKPDDYGVFPSGTTCWVKADPTFEGVLQLLHEPAARTHLGVEPPKLAKVKASPTKYLRSITILRKAASDLKERWFDGTSLEFNPDLVAIIGNKGSGKSALADIIGLLGMSKNEKYFSFLTPQKFRHARLERASHFSATLTWHDGKSATCSLDEHVSPTAVERVKYLPQSYIEDVCNELKTGASSAFDQELKEVIFSWVPEEERLDADSLDALLEQRTGQVEQTLLILRGQLRELNKEIIELERRSSDETAQTLDNKIKLKEGELHALEASKPNAPQALTPEQAEALKMTSQQMDAARKEIDSIEASIKKDSDSLKGVLARTAKLNNVSSQITNFETQYRNFHARTARDADELGIVLDTVVKFTVDRTSLNQLSQMLQDEQEQLRGRLDDEAAGGWPQRKRAAVERLARLQATLEGPQRDQEAYKTTLDEWNKRRAALIGAADAPDSLEHFRAAKQALAHVPAQLSGARERRTDLVVRIFSEIAGLAQMYRDIYAPVQRFIGEHKLVTERFNLSFEVTIQPQGFEDGLFSRIKRNVSGSFCGDEESSTRTLRGLLSKYDFAAADDVAKFVNDVADRLMRNYQLPDKSPVSVSEQLRKGATVEELYQFVFGLEYLTPRYALRMGGKDLTQLSPGERGALLLMFYLLVDRDDIPLIVDQPEENLDNQTVYRMLGACITEAKKRRQIIIVTHNPNLAVACDAEQIICASHHPQDGERIDYLAGAIEHPQINRCLLDILEGTRPAFENREAKYMDAEALPEGGRITLR
jgi:ABC-type lipoprotein export system ATPase subunit